MVCAFNRMDYYLLYIKIDLVMDNKTYETGKIKVLTR